MTIKQRVAALIAAITRALHKAALAVHFAALKGTIRAAEDFVASKVPAVEKALDYEAFAFQLHQDAASATHAAVMAHNDAKSSLSATKAAFAAERGK